MDKRRDKKIKWSLIIAGFLFLFMAAFFENTRGPLIPFLAQKLNISYSVMSWFLVLGQVCALPALLILTKAAKMFSSKFLVFFICAMAGLSPVMAAFSTSVLPLMVLGGLIGMTGAILGTVSNILVIQGTSDENRGRFLSGLHLMYGIGGFLTPMTVSIFIEQSYSWSLLYLIPLPILAICLFAAFRFPDSTDNQDEEPSVDEPSVFSAPAIMILLIYGMYVVGEVTTSMWLPTFMVEHAKMSVVEAARYQSYFFLALAGSRALCFLFVRRKYETPVLIASLVVPCIVYVIAFSGSYKVLPLVGLAGPFFALFLARISRVFPTHWKSLAIWLMISIDICLGISHYLLGGLADRVGIYNAYYFPFGFLVLACGLLFVYFRVERKYT